MHDAALGSPACPAAADHHLLSPLLQASGWLLGLVMTMCLLFPVGMLVMAVVDEKEHRLKQTLKISGLRHASWAGGWYATALLQVTGCHCRHRLH